MIGKLLEINWEIVWERLDSNEGCPDSHEVFSGFLCLSRRGKNRNALNITRHYKKRKKDLMKHGECVLHKVFNSYHFLASQRMPNFALLMGLEDV